MPGLKMLGTSASGADDILRVSDINSIQNTAPTPQFDGDRWYDNDNGKEYIAIRNTGSVLVWIEVGSGASGAGLLRTVTTLPSSGVRGDCVFCLADMKMYVYYGATTGWKQPWNEPWGYVLELTSGVDVTGIGTTETNVISGSVTCLANRLYHVEAYLHYAQTVATDVFAVRTYLGASRTAYYAPTPDVQNHTIPLSPQLLASASGSQTMRITVQRQSGTGTVSVLGLSYMNTTIRCIDVGPGGSAPSV